MHCRIAPQIHQHAREQVDARHNAGKVGVIVDAVSPATPYAKAID